MNLAIRILIGLYFFVLADAVASEPARPPRPPRASAKAAPPAEEKKIAWMIDSDWKTNREDAWKDAVEKTQAKLARWFRSRNWRPSAEYVENRLVKGRKDREKVFDEIGPMQQVALSIEVTARDHDDMLRQARSTVSEQRMFGLGKLLAALVALLGAFGGYVRLDEWTKGYYTNWLRLGVAGGFLILVALAFFAR